MESVKRKLINTENLFRRYSSGNGPSGCDNIAVGNGTIRIDSSYSYTESREIALPAGLQVDGPVRDLAVDECDRIFLLTGSRVYLFDRASGTIEEVGCGEAGKRSLEFDHASGIGVDRDTLYIADRVPGLDPPQGRITAVARSNLQIRWRVTTGGEDPLGEILDLAVGLHGEIWCIEKSGSSGSMGSLITIGRSGNGIPYTLHREEFKEPSDVTVDARGNIAVLSSSGVDIFVYDPVQKQFFKNAEKSSEVPFYISGQAKGLAISPGEEIIIGYRGSGFRNPDQECLHIQKGPWPSPWTRSWSYRGTVSRLVLDSRNNLYVIDGEGKTFTFVLYRETVTRNSDNRYSGTYVSRPIDSTVEKTRWHRFLLEGDFPAGTMVEFSYAVSDSTGDADFVWKKGLPESSALQGTERRTGLFRETNEGRYLRFKIVLTGTENLSPVVRSVSLFFPRITWLEYLPPIYQDNPESRDFLERFLSLFEPSFSETEYSIEHLGQYLDPAGTPGEFLDWLASWLSLALDDNWPVDRRRRLISRAMELYKKRGTRQGLGDMIEMYSDKRPYIVEVFSGTCTSRCPEKTGSGECGSEGKDIFFPPAGAEVAIPGVFRWDEVLKNDGTKLVEYLKKRYSLEWLRADRIKKNGNVITIAESESPLPDTITVTLSLAGSTVRVEKNGELLEIMTADKGEHGMIINATIGLQELLYGKELFNYYVFIPGEPPPDPVTLNVIRTIIEDQQPAHTCFGLRVLEPWFCLDRHTYLGINTALTLPSFILGKESVLGRDTVLGDREEGGQIGYHSQMGVNARLT